MDPTGRYIYLLTSQGLTIVDLGQASLSIGSLNISSASPGTSITLSGSGFTDSTTVTVGGVAAATTFVDEDTLTVTVPALGVGPADIVLSNSDGTTYTLQSGIDIL